jgi:flavin-binding protein dodecin
MDNVSDTVEIAASSATSWEDAALSALDASGIAGGQTAIAEVLEQRLERNADGVTYHIVLAVRSEVEMGAGSSVIDVRTESKPARRYLLVANQTLASGALEELIHELVQDGSCHFHVVVPQVSTATVHVDPSGLINASVHPAASDAYSLARRDAESRLRSFRELFDEAPGADLTGEVVVGDPLQAVRRVLEKSSFDQVIVSTLPAGVSKWLRMDLPHRIERAVDLPVISLVQNLEVQR